MAKGRKKHSSSKGLRSALSRHIINEGKNKLLEKKSTSKNHVSIKGGENVKVKVSGKSVGLLPFTSSSRVLLVGDGDFSFAVSIIQEGYVYSEYLVASGYDTREEAIAKYPNAEGNLKFLEREGIKVFHSIDATDLVSSFKITKNKKKNILQLFPLGDFDYIMFNFPHTGRGVKDVTRNIMEHQHLITGYFRSCKQLFEVLNVVRQNNKTNYRIDETLHPDRIILSIFEGEPYDSWNIRLLGKSEGYKVHRSGNFSWEMFPSYVHKRTKSNMDTTKPARERKARIYIFEEISK